MLSWLERMHSPFVGWLLLGITDRLRGRDTLGFLKEIAPVPFRSKEVLQVHQFRLLSALLTHAETHVPYYRELFRSLGIRSSEIRNLQDFAQLPILTKDIVRDRQADLIREDIPRNTLIPHQSGGSTGVPLSFFCDRSYLDASDAGTYRNFLQCGWQPGEMTALLWGTMEKTRNLRRWQFELRQHVRRMYHFDAFQSGPEDMDRWRRRWRSLRPSVAFGYASTLSRLAHYIETSGRPVPPLKGVFSTGEILFEPQRQLLSRVFGCRVFDCYGSSEVRNIASECPRGSMHINADYALLEEDPAPPRLPGQPVPFLVTSLQNWTMPFIRYRNDDHGSLKRGECGCGNNFPRMELSIGRVNDSFVMPDGRVVHGLFFTYLMYGSEGIASFQFHQRSEYDIVLWVVPGPGGTAARQGTIQRAIEQIQALGEPGQIKVEVRETAVIPLSPAGKHLYIRSDVRAPVAPAPSPPSREVSDTSPSR